MPSLRPHGGRSQTGPAAVRRLLVGLLWLVAFAGGGFAPAVRAESLTPGGRLQASFFDSLETRADDISAFRKWGDALTRSAGETAAGVDADCGEGGDAGCPYRDWLRFLDGLRVRDRWQQLLAVNDEINRRRYVADAANYGQEDYWASAGEFLLRDAGDCEDYAIVKYLSLKRLGWREGDLRLAAVKDLQLRIGHAVLIAFHDNRAWLLDNQIGQVVDARAVRHYQPLYSINERAWWRHQPRGWTGADGSSTVAREDPAAR